jgi:hypothetical protein
MTWLGNTGRARVRAKWAIIGLVVALFLLAFDVSAALPDLTIFPDPAIVAPEIIFRTFASGDCEVVEGCAIAGTRRLLSFNSEIRNVGTVDLNMGPPGGTNLFVWAPCHGHYHFEDFAIYRLLNASGSVVVTGRKMAFCLEDTKRWRSTAPTARRYSCNTVQGIQAGWADVYDKAVPCQWIDITGIPGGTYTLELVIDPNNHIAEENEGNNVTRLPVSIPGGCTAPANDSFSGALLLTGVATSAVGDNACATKEAGEPNHAGEPGGHSVWYRWTAPYNGTVTINTVGSDFDTLLAVYTGSAYGSLNLIAQNDDIVPFEVRQSQVTFNAVSNTTYRIAVDGWNSQVGGIKLNVNPPPNDAFANCVTLTGAAGQVTGHNIGATKQPGELAHAGNIGGHSVWYCWTAPTNGVWIFDTINSDFDTLLAIYTGTAVNSLTPIVSDDDSGGNNKSRVSLSAAGGTNYRIAVDGSSGATGIINLRWATLSTNAIRVALREMTNGAKELTITADPGTYLIQVSSNLATWTTLTTVTTTNTPYRYTDSQMSARRFYRVRR